MTDSNSPEVKIPHSSFTIDLRNLPPPDSEESILKKQEQTLKQLSTDEKISRLEGILEKPLDYFGNQAREARILAIDLAGTNPDLSRRVVSDYVEDRIKARKVDDPTYLEARVAIPILSVLGDTDGIKKIANKYIDKYVDFGMDANNKSDIDLDDMREVLLSATGSSPQVTPEIFRALIRGEGHLKHAVDYRYSRIGKVPLQEAHRLQDESQVQDARNFYVAGGLLVLAGQLAINAGDKKLGQEALDLLSKYESFIVENDYEIEKHGQNSNDKPLKVEFSNVKKQLSKFVTTH